MNRPFRSSLSSHSSDIYSDEVYDSMIDWIRSVHLPLQPLPTGVPPEKDLSLRDAKGVLIDIYGTLLISRAGEVGTASLSSAEKFPLFDEFEKRGILFNRVTYSELQGRIRLLIKESHEKSDKEFPEVDILLIWQEVLVQLKRDGFYEGETDEITAAWASLIYEWSENPCDIMPGGDDFLADLIQREVPWGIVSNSQFYTPLICDALLGDKLEGETLSPSLSSWSFLLREAKPSPALFLPVLKELKDRHDILPDEVLYIGNDMRNDVCNFQSLGGRGVLFAGDATSLRWREKELPDASPRYCLNSWQNFLDFFSAYL